MTARAGIQLLATLFVAIYSTLPTFWLVVHPWARRNRNAGKVPYVLALPVWALFACLAFSLAWHFHELLLYENWAAWIPGVAFILMGFAIYRRAFHDFDRNIVSGLTELNPAGHDQRLIITGTRSQVRHPIYLGHFCETFGWCVGTGSFALMALLAFGVATGALMIREEERELEQRFGERFREYQQRVPAFLPGKR